MNRKLTVVLILLLFCSLAAGASVHANGTHPVSDNMCGAHSYGNCFHDSQWIRGWYAYLRHTTTELSDSDTTNDGWREDEANNRGSYTGQPREPDESEVSSPQTTGSSNQACHVDWVTVNGVDYQRCISQTRYWCQLYHKHRNNRTRRDYVLSIAPSSLVSNLPNLNWRNANC